MKVVEQQEKNSAEVKTTKKQKNSKVKKNKEILSENQAKQTEKSKAPSSDVKSAKENGKNKLNRVRDRRVGKAKISLKSKKFDKNKKNNKFEKNKKNKDNVKSKSRQPKTFNTLKPKGKGKKLNTQKTTEETISGNDQIKVEEPPVPSSDVVLQAIKGVRTLASKQNESKKTDLLGEEENELIYLQISVFKVVDTFRNPYYRHIIRSSRVNIKLPHSVVHSNTDVLLIAKDRNHEKSLRSEHTINLHEQQQKLRNCGAASHISEVVTLHQLKTEYKEISAKRQLANRSDVVLCDDTILFRIPMFLGKSFYSKHKYPIPVNLKSKDLFKEITQVLKKEILVLPNTGNSAIMKIGHLELTDDMIKENIECAIKSIKNLIPGGWINVQNLGLKLKKSKSVPFHINLTNTANDVPRLEPRKLSKNETISGELSTWFGDTIAVTPNDEIIHVRNYDKRKDYEELNKKDDEKKVNKKRKEETAAPDSSKKKRKTNEPKSDENALDKLDFENLDNLDIDAVEKEYLKTITEGGDGEVNEEDLKKAEKELEAESLMETDLPVSEKKKKKKKEKANKSTKTSTEKKKKKKSKSNEEESADLESMEMEYLKSLNVEEANNPEEEDDDDWAENTDDDDDEN